MKASRRAVLKWLGVQLALPAIAPHLAFGQTAPGRKRFIGCYVPNGAHMPMGVDGSWTWSEALAPLVSRNLRQHAMIVRKLHNGFGGIDPHWQNCAGFLSCQPILLNSPGLTRCGKTVDQYVADRHPASIRSLEIGGIYYHVHPLNDHPGYSNDYLNRISWQEADKFRSPIPNPAQLFNKLFGGQEGSAAQIAYLHARKKSVLDQLHKDATRLAARLPETYRPVLTSYLATVREVEQGLQQGGFTCTPTLAQPTEDFSAPNTNYALRFQLMHQMIVLAMQCGLTNVATIMYGPGVSEQLDFAEALGAGTGHHANAHHGGSPGAIARLKQMNVVQVSLLADLLEKLKAANLLDETLVLYGSDMSDGNVHLPRNLPMILCGAGSDLRFGQEIVPAAERPLSDLHLELFNLLGVSSITSFGSGECASTGQPVGIRV
ncbi:MAG: DUF1552 domain-containing protein [Myxococcales bacterium]|nr:DUF1552 domain-containing protein [Myxococcales bacterium]